MIKYKIAWITALLFFLAMLPVSGQETPGPAGPKRPGKEEPKKAEAEEKCEDQGARLLRFPDIHEDKVVFVYGGDLWLCSNEGGTARRLTSHPGSETGPKFSPDGKLIAFSASYDGNNDVYVIAAKGGEPRRLTYHPSPDQAIGWTPDGKKVLFLSPRRSAIMRFARMFTVSLDGGFPEALPMPEAGFGSFSPDGNRIAYNRISREGRSWKRYKGGMAQDIWIYNLDKNEVEQITDFEGTDNFPMWTEESKLYFVSDRSHAANIFCYSFETKKVRQITRHQEFDVKWPSMGPGAIVYEDGGFLCVFDMKTEEARKLCVKLPYDRAALRPAFKGVSDYITDFDVSPSGNFGLFSARGDIFTLSAAQGTAKNLTKTPAERERNAVWSPDGKWIAYLSDKTGEYEIYMRPADGSGQATTLTKEGTCFKFQPLWSPDSSKLVFTDKTRTLFYVDVKKKTPVPIDCSKYAGLVSYFDSKWEGIDGYTWSPDSKWIAYSKTGASFFKSILLYSIDHGKVFPVTDQMTDDSDPAFDKNGKYLYFVSRRTFLPSMDMFDQTTYTYSRSERIYMVTLQKELTSPFETISEEKEPVTGGGSFGPPSRPGTGTPAAPPGAGGKPSAAPAKPGFHIDIDGLAGRTLDLPVSPGNYSDLKAANGKLFYISSPPSGDLIASSNPMGRSLCCFDITRKRGAAMMSGVQAYSLAASDTKIIYQAAGSYGIIPATQGSFPPGTGKLATNRLEMKVDYASEWKQIFAEAWRIERDFFYDPGMHGVDWNMMKERYGKLIPHLSSRSDLNYVLGELIGEICAGHTYVFGGDIPSLSRTPVGLLGADFEPDKRNSRYRFAKIYKGQEMDPSAQGPLAKPGAAVKEGEYLLAVNGRELRTRDNLFSFFVNAVGKDVRITVNTRPSMRNARTITVSPIGSESGLRYYDWVEENRRKVDEASDSRIGYIHLPDTSIEGLIEFSKAFFAYYRRDGLIIDERYNGGGLIPDMFMEHLRRELVCYFHPRGTEDFQVPSITPPPHMACVTNAYAGSGGDAFPYYFREYGLGPLVGTRTWGGLIGIPRNFPLVDGGLVTAPEFGIFDLNGEWIVENHGVDPDIEVDNRPDLVVKGHDPQLEKAIEVVLEAIRKEPRKDVKRAPFPIRK